MYGTSVSPALCPLMHRRQFHMTQLPWAILLHCVVLRWVVSWWFGPDLDLMLKLRPLWPVVNVLKVVWLGLSWQYVQKQKNKQFKTVLTDVDHYVMDLKLIGVSCLFEAVLTGSEPCYCYSKLFWLNRDYLFGGWWLFDWGWKQYTKVWGTRTNPPVDHGSPHLVWSQTRFPAPVVSAHSIEKETHSFRHLHRSRRSVGCLGKQGCAVISLAFCLQRGGPSWGNLPHISAILVLVNIYPTREQEQGELIYKVNKSKEHACF